MTQTILVTGGTGTLGRRVVSRLRGDGRAVRVLTRRTPSANHGVEYARGDLLKGEGIEAAVEGVTAIVHCAGSTTGDETMTRNLVQALSRQAGKPHLTFISVVGADR